MVQKAIDTIKVKPLVVHTDLRGRLYECWRSDSDAPPVEQVIVTTLRPGVVKGWHKHQFQFDQVICIQGEIQVAWWIEEAGLDRPFELDWTPLSSYDMNKVIIPPGYWHGFQNLGTKEAFVLEMVSELYDKDNPDDERMDPHNIHGDVWIKRDS
jgi:dTDP-4-dehydrorhamnose 3,5-epimerase